MKELTHHELITVSAGNRNDNTTLQFGTLVGSLGAIATFVGIGFLPPITLALRTQLTAIVGIMLTTWAMTKQD